MSDVYEEVFHHIVWGTKNREPMIVPRLETILYAHIRQKCAEMKISVHAINRMPDHIHLVCSVPASLAVSDFVKRIKGGSSHFVNHHDFDTFLFWQPGYAVLTFSAHDLRRVTSYVENQKAHHENGKLSSKMEYIPDIPSNSGIASSVME